MPSAKSPTAGPALCAKQLPPEVKSELAELYGDARGLANGALRDHGEPAAADALPTTCPYRLDQITGNWLPK